MHHVLAATLQVHEVAKHYPMTSYDKKPLSRRASSPAASVRSSFSAACSGAADASPPRPAGRSKQP